MPERDLAGRGVLGRGARMQSPPQAGHERAGGDPGVGVLTLHGGLRVKVPRGAHVHLHVYLLPACPLVCVVIKATISSHLISLPATSSQTLGM